MDAREQSLDRGFVDSMGNRHDTAREAMRAEIMYMIRRKH
jgi:hypothetical protein